MWEISKEFHFSASHQLGDLPESHQCARLHGHNYILVVRLSSPTLEGPGFVIDYGDLTFVKEWADRMDHRHLNDLFPFNPTSENTIWFLWEEIRKSLDNRGFGHVKLAVGLSETPKTWAWYDGPSK